MVVDQVEGAKFDEIVEIELINGEIRRSEFLK